MRERLPNRRFGETWEFQHSGTRFALSATRYPDGRLAEVFVSGIDRRGERRESELAASARDAAILVSIALQSGVEIVTMKDAVTRLEGEQPASITGRVLDELCGKTP